METKYLELEQAFKNNGIVYINTWSRDCDGVNAIGHREFNNIEEFYKWEESYYEWAEGPCGWELTTKENINEEITYGGWDLNY